MKDVETFEGELIRRERLPSSYLGNPRYSLTIGEPGESITACTMPNSGLSYGPAANVKIGQKVRARIGWHYGRLQIEDIRSIEGDEHETPMEG